MKAATKRQWVWFAALWAAGLGGALLLTGTVRLVVQLGG